MRITFHPEAEVEFNEAVLWYSKQSIGLDIEFVRCIDEAVNRINRNPDSFPITYKQLRKTVLKKFPFIILYESLKDEIRIIAVFHTRRNPKNWQKRS
ncbi:MAG: type II toxin-antitoxin system RelE/ParE family toxin [Ignavibacteriaceae bacterium]